MSFHTLSVFLALALSVHAQNQAVVWAPVKATNTYPNGTALADKRFPYPNLPDKADTGDGIRGGQSGFNFCDSTTGGQDSMCQTATVNAVDDFCLWAPSKIDVIANTEGEEVAWCSKPGRGTRVIPQGAIQGIQYMRTPDYIQITGFIDQELINIQSGDSGGELDPHGADLRGNPLGGLVYSNAFPASAGDAGKYVQAIEWHNFMGSDSFCFKICDPLGPANNSAGLCQHVYDRIGVSYNCPSAPTKGVFEMCEGDNQDPPGIYTSAGAVQTYQQPPESLGAISTMPYQPRVPASSNCRSFSSTALYSNQPTASVKPKSSAASSTSRAMSTSRASSSSGGAPPASTGTSSAGTVAISMASTLFGVALSVFVLA